MVISTWNFNNFITHFTWFKLVFSWVQTRHNYSFRNIISIKIIYKSAVVASCTYLFYSRKINLLRNLILYLSNTLSKWICTPWKYLSTFNAIVWNEAQVKKETFKLRFILKFWLKNNNTHYHLKNKNICL